MTKIETLKKSIGKRIREYRLKANMSQRQLADSTEMTETSVRNYEAGRTNMTIEALVKIKQELNIEELFI